jgi:hypothetical protein
MKQSHKYVLAALLGALILNIGTYWEHLIYMALENHDHAIQIEKTCIELGKSARRELGKSDRDTDLFETLGCCYNDGLTEPKGC